MSPIPAAVAYAVGPANLPSFIARSDDLASTSPSSSSSYSDATVGWHHSPDGRGTWDLLVSCVITLTLCVWSALHLNVPPEMAKLRHRAVERTKWVLYGIFAPELVVAVAAAQYWTARWLRREISRDAGFRKRSRLEKECHSPNGEVRGGNGRNCWGAGLKKVFGWNPKSRVYEDGDTRKGKQKKGQDDGRIPEDEDETWNMTQCYFAVMGGFVTWLDIPGVDNNDKETGLGSSSSSSAGRRVTLTAEGIRLLSLLNRLPKIATKQIKDKSKADSLAKTIVVAQAAWMLIQVVGRLAAGLPISLLEINTCGHVVCALVLYLLWWNKPLDIHDPTVLRLSGNNHLDEQVLALMYVCSYVSIPRKRAVNAIRCFTYNPPAQCRDLGPHGGDQAGDDSPKVAPARLPISPPAVVTWSTNISLGSTGVRNLATFLGLKDGTVGVVEEHTRPSQHQQTQLRYRYHLPNIISPDCKSIYFTPSYLSPDISLKHCHAYCRRALGRGREEELGPFAPIPLALLTLAAHAADEVWDVSMARPECRPYYFTVVFVPSSSPLKPVAIPASLKGHKNRGLNDKERKGEEGGIVPFLGETDYLTWHVKNRPPLWNLNLGQVNLRRDALPTIFALTAAAYGALHCTAWSRQPFPTVYEQRIWASSSLTIGASGLCVLLQFLIRRGSSKRRRHGSMGISRQESSHPRMETRWWERNLTRTAMSMALGLFVLAKLFIVIEAFISLRRAPTGVYETVEWDDWLPHF
ncbi:hypothetical protein MKZ38_005780 [Zalerion maritima]|uniref:Uncharacterized protein n=1 Tax=Zalerion maritima TaxID=339359 RepID=A0AAD5WQ20_9PEZI|nr:hypothetical protein MKZ38_005780 [Zalerion maritima]